MATQRPEVEFRVKDHRREASTKFEHDDGAQACSQKENAFLETGDETYFLVKDQVVYFPFRQRVSRQSLGSDCEGFVMWVTAFLRKVTKLSVVHGSASSPPVIPTRGLFH